MGYVHYLYDNKRTSSCFAEMEELHYYLRILALWLLSILLKICININKLEEGWRVDDKGGLLFDHSKGKRWKILML